MTDEPGLGLIPSAGEEVEGEEPPNPDNWRAQWYKYSGGQVGVMLMGEKLYLTPQPFHTQVYSLEKRLHVCPGGMCKNVHSTTVRK